MSNFFEPVSRGQKRTKTAISLLFQSVRSCNLILLPSYGAKLTPHQLRHHFLKLVTDRHGVHYAQRLSGNVSIREVFRYAKPSDEEIAKDVEELFG